MARVTRVAPHLTLDEVKQKLHAATKPWLQQRWQVSALSRMSNLVTLL